MDVQATPLYGILTWPNDDVADGVMLIIGWQAYGHLRYPVAVETDGHNGPARLFAPNDRDDAPWIDYYLSYDEAWRVLRDTDDDKKRIGWTVDPAMKGAAK